MFQIWNRRIVGIAFQPLAGHGASRVATANSVWSFKGSTSLGWAAADAGRGRSSKMSVLHVTPRVWDKHAFKKTAADSYFSSYFINLAVILVVILVAL